jgi:hypothetical protein
LKGQTSVSRAYYTEYIPPLKDNDNDALETLTKGAKACTCCVPRFEIKTRNSRRENEAED